jgi:hypothetical protein
MRSEPQYFDVDENGSSPEEIKTLQIPKWRQTQTQFQVDVLAIFGMKYFPKDDRDAKVDLIEIERGMAPLATIPNLNKTLQDDHPMHPYPKEWVDFGITWTKSKRTAGVPIKLRALINFLKNKERMISWLEKQGKYVFTQEKKYVTRKVILEETHASMEKNHTDFDY